MESISAIAGSSLPAEAFDEILRNTLTAFPTGGDPTVVRAHIDASIRSAASSSPPPTITTTAALEYQAIRNGGDAGRVEFPLFSEPDEAGLTPATGIAVHEGPSGNCSNIRCFGLRQPNGKFGMFECYGSGDSAVIQLTALPFENNYARIFIDANGEGHAMIEISGASRGVLAKLGVDANGAPKLSLASPDGTLWKLTINNAGVATWAPDV